MDNITTYMVRAFVVEKNISQHFTVFQYDTGHAGLSKQLVYRYHDDIVKDNIATYMFRVAVVESEMGPHPTVIQYDTGLTRIPKVARDEKTVRKGDVAKDQEPAALLKVPVITNLMDETLLLAIVFLRQTQNHIDDDLDAEPYVDVNVI